VAAYLARTPVSSASVGIVICGISSPPSRPRTRRLLALRSGSIHLPHPARQIALRVRDLLCPLCHFRRGVACLRSERLVEEILCLGQLLCRRRSAVASWPLTPYASHLQRAQGRIERSERLLHLTALMPTLLAAAPLVRDCDCPALPR